MLLISLLFILFLGVVGFTTRLYWLHIKVRISQFGACVYERVYIHYTTLCSPCNFPRPPFMRGASQGVFPLCSVCAHVIPVIRRLLVQGMQNLLPLRILPATPWFHVCILGVRNNLTNIQVRDPKFRWFGRDGFRSTTWWWRIHLSAAITCPASFGSALKREANPGSFSCQITSISRWVQWRQELWKPYFFYFEFYAVCLTRLLFFTYRNPSISKRDPPPPDKPLKKNVMY